MTYGEIVSYIEPGAVLRPDGAYKFNVWAPERKRISVHFLGPPGRFVKLSQTSDGYFTNIVQGVKAGELYYLKLDDGLERPDPASRSQPRGVHGPSEVVSNEYPWTDADWHGIPLDKYLIYELHVGAFSPQGTFAGIVEHLDYLVGLGITAIELMPVAQFPGRRNWGYDGVFPYAVQDSYGGVSGLKSLIDACHNRGLAVVLDVVYNHLGPEGNYLRDFGPYFTKRYSTPWGEAVNYDGPGCKGVRNFIISNALYWVNSFHIDALRLDAVHAIFDGSPVNIIEELTVAIHHLGRRLHRCTYVIAESNANDVRLFRSCRYGGYGVDAIWNDDFHHSLHTLLTKEKNGYYADFGRLTQLKKALAEGFVYSGQYAPFWQRNRGTSSKGMAAKKFVVFAQNHDQVGNRMVGERLTRLISYEALKLAAATVILSANIPLIFMGEEYAETAPFLYFVDHSDLRLIEAVRKGRFEEFKSFEWRKELPDPASPATFLSSILNLNSIQFPGHREMLDYYRKLISLRRSWPVLSRLSKSHMRVKEDTRGFLCIERHRERNFNFLYLNFSNYNLRLDLPLSGREWYLLFDSADVRWHGPGTLTKQMPSGRISQAVMQPLSALMISSVLHNDSDN